MTLKKLILENNKDYNFKTLKIYKPNQSFLNLIRKEKIRNSIFIKSINRLNKKENFLFLLRVLDFRLWEYPSNWNYKDRKDFFGLLERFKNLFGLDLEKLNFKIFKKIISPKENIVLARLRYRIFKNSLKWLKENYDGSFGNYFEENKKPFNFCLNLLSLEKFQDYYKNFYFLKPNQLLYYEYILGMGLLKKFENELEELTIFADYRIPQLFLNLGLINLSKKYLNKILNKDLIKKHSLLENELRLASIILGEGLVKELGVSSYFIDNLLWQLSYKIKFKIPNIRVKTIFY